MACFRRTYLPHWHSCRDIPLTLEILRVCVKGASAPTSEYEVPLRARRAELQKESKDDPVNPPAACTDAPVFLISLAKYFL